MTTSGTGVRVEPGALQSFAGATRDTAGAVDASASGLGDAAPAARGLGPLADEAGLVAALADRTAQHTMAVAALSAALRGAADAVTGALAHYEQTEQANQDRLQGSGSAL
ncbi:hypothetical protein GCM10027047_08380 [Rhodococcus aerolatus]